MIARRPMFESDLVEMLTESLVREGYKVRVEVPNMGQSADVVATRNRWVTIIEVKVKDWRRALEQCTAHEQVGDFIGIAIGTGRIAPELLSEASLRGYGLLHCIIETGACEWILRPKRNLNVWRPQRDHFSNALKAVAHERRSLDDVRHVCSERVL